MAKLHYVHWNENECLSHARELAEAGHEVTPHWETGSHTPVGPETEALVVSLDRLPSHGRALAEWFWEAKSRRVKPILFVGGETAKIEETRRKFPQAQYCPRENWTAALGALLGSPCREPSDAR